MSANHPEAPLAAQVRHLERVLEERGVVDGAELDEALDRFLATAAVSNGQRVVARAWTDPEFRERLLADAGAAVADLGFTSGLKAQVLHALANTPTVHNVVVCTLCSCYPLLLLGPSPSWYKGEAYRSRVVREPRAVLAEFGLQLGADVEIRVWDASAETRYLVVPQRPAGTEGHAEAELASLVTRHGLIGTAAV